MKKWEGVGHEGMTQGKSSFKASSATNNEDEAAHANLSKQRISYEEWSAKQKCHHCGTRGHVWPQCKKYLANIESGKIQPVCSPKPAAITHGREHQEARDKF